MGTAAGGECLGVAGAVATIRAATVRAGAMEATVRAVVAAAAIAAAIAALAAVAGPLPRHRHAAEQMLHLPGVATG